MYLKLAGLSLYRLTWKPFTLGLAVDALAWLIAIELRQQTGGHVEVATVVVLGVILTFSIFLATVIFHTGKLTARVEALEKWREGVRNDLHEVSDKLEIIRAEIKTMTTLIDERTERRMPPRV